MSTPSPVLAVLLAAGAGSRFRDGGPDAATSPRPHKLLAPLRGRPLVAHAVEAVLATGLDLVVVTGAERAVGPLALEMARAAGAERRVRIVDNPDWASGQASSLRRGIAVATADGRSAIVVGLADQPFVTRAAWNAVAAAVSPVAVATYGERRGHPVRLGAEVWSDLPDTGDSGARDLMRLRPDLVEEVPCQGSADDVDTLEDLQRWN